MAYAKAPPGGRAGPAVAALGWDLSADAFWGVAPHAQRLVDPILADVTSVTNIGLIYGAIAASRWSGPADFSLPSGKRLIAAADEAAKVADGKYATDKYLKLLKEQQK